MKKQITTVFLTSTILASTLPFTSQAHVAHADNNENNFNYLHSEGKHIKNGDKTFQIKGVNAGNVFTTEAWLGGLGASEQTDYKNINNKYDDIDSPKEAHKALDRYANNRWDDQDFENVKNMGGNTIRLPINYINLTSYKKDKDTKDLEMRDKPFKAMDKFIDKANKHDLRVIIDMHGVPESQNAQEHSAERQEDSKYGKFWDNPDAQGKAKEIWYNIADHYKNNPGVAGYDLLNEPKAPAGHVDKQVKDFYKDTIGSIRENDKNHMIILEAWYPDDLKNPDEFGDKQNNIAYEYHKYPYEKETESHKGIRKAMDDEIEMLKSKADQYQVPTYLGEFNAHYAGNQPEGTKPVDVNKEDFNHMFKSLNENNTNWTLWNYDKEGNNDSWGVMNFKGINVDRHSDDFGKKEKPQLNQDVYNAIKNANN